MLRFSTAVLQKKKFAPAALFQQLNSNKITNFYGVPDSLLKDFCAFVTDNAPTNRHVITANEGAAASMACGYHLATGNIPCIYMQNSGYGNTINPILSLSHQQVYSIPMLMLIGWRGDPTGKKDEPQHIAQGRLQEECLKACEVPYSVLEPVQEDVDTEKVMSDIIGKAKAHFDTCKSPYAILIKRDTFEGYKLQSKASDIGTMTREEAIEEILTNIGEKDIVVSTTGMPSREVFEVRAKGKQGHHRDFLTVGSMGHCSAIAAGIAMEKPDRNVFIIDGDGAYIMHMGTIAINGGLTSSLGHLKNLKHIVVNNGAHDSVGGQPTCAAINVGWITKTAQVLGYTAVSDKPITAKEEVKDAVRDMSSSGMKFLEVLVKKGNRADIGRPTTTPIQNKEAFMNFVETGRGH
eukprot:Tbor_TRINITY_DN4479_c0_g3::TRINITY_DN4479_c0_g3_i1::g.7901::m.7901/K09459/E4.1.1.82; phosphonopyruvate decarboxylase